MGPSNNSQQAIHRSLLRDSGGTAAFQKRLICGLFPGPEKLFLEYARELLEKAGIADLQDLRSLDGLPQKRLLCREAREELAGPPDGDPLLHAAVLGLCNASFYSPDRTLVWTESRLQRRVELFSVEGFYED